MSLIMTFLRISNSNDDSIASTLRCSAWTFNDISVSEAMHLDVFRILLTNPPPFRILLLPRTLFASVFCSTIHILDSLSATVSPRKVTKGLNPYWSRHRMIVTSAFFGFVLDKFQTANARAVRPHSSATSNVGEFRTSHFENDSFFLEIGKSPAIDTTLCNTVHLIPRNTITVLIGASNWANTKTISPLKP